MIARCSLVGFSGMNSPFELGMTSTGRFSFSSGQDFFQRIMGA